MVLSNKRKEVDNISKDDTIQEEEEQEEKREQEQIQLTSLSAFNFIKKRKFSKRVIAVSAKIGAGKNFMMEQILLPWFIQKLGLHIRVIALADELKKRCNDKHQLTFEELFIEKDVKSRQLLQREGVEAREKESPDVWIKKLDFQMKIDFFYGVDIVLVCDLRFQNEKQYFEDRGDALCIRIDAPKRTLDKVRREAKNDEVKMKEIMNHISETDLDSSTFDIQINNDYDQEATSGQVLIEALKPFFI